MLSPMYPRRRVTSLLFLSMALLCLWTTTAQAQTEAGSTPGSSTPVTAASKYEMLTVGGKRMVAVNGRPLPLFWADDITRVAQLDEYKAAGFNTVVVRLLWRPTEDGALVATDLEPQRNFANAAAQRGLHVIYSLPPAPATMERTFRFAADSDAYMMTWTTWVLSAIEKLESTPNLMGWMLPDDPRALPYADDKGFSQWLRVHYADANALNRQWATAFPGFENVTIKSVDQVVQMWRGLSLPDPSMSADEWRARAEQLSKRQPAQNFAVHPAALALAEYRWDAYRALLDAWAGVVEEADPQRLIFSGRLPDYAQLLSLPPRIDVSIPDMRPGMAEADDATHNPQAIDIARRGGRFAAIPVLSTTGSEDLPPQTIAGSMKTWATTALAHAASGLVLHSWRDLQGDRNLREAVTAALQHVNAAPLNELWEQAPVATSAVLLTPLADAYTLRMATGAAAPDEAPVEPRGLYGFGENLVEGEPGDLVYALRHGTAFGSVDYISPDELGGTAAQDGTGTRLSRYSTLLMPQAFHLPPEATAELSGFVRSGGVVLADLGAGAFQAGGDASMLTPGLSELFGIAPRMEIRTLSFNLRTMQAHPLLPAWSATAATRGGAILTGGDGPNGAAFAGPLAFVEMLPGTDPLALAFELRQELENANRPARFLRSWLSVREHGEGYAVFAPFRMWHYWRPGYKGFDEFHGDLLGRGAALVQSLAASIVPEPRLTSDRSTLYPETVNLAQAILLVNHNPAPPPEEPKAEIPPPAPPETKANSKTRPRYKSNKQLGKDAPKNGEANTADGEKAEEMLPAGSRHTIVQTTGVGDFLWSGSACAFPNTQARLAGGRPAPIAEPNEFETEPHPVSLHTVVKPQEANLLQLLPVRAQNPSGGPLVAHVVEYSGAAARVVIWPNATKVIATATSYDVAIAPPGPVRLTLYGTDKDDDYRIRPGSRHQVKITDFITPAGAKNPPAPETKIVTANEQGRLIIETRGASLMVEVKPA